MGFNLDEFKRGVAKFVDSASKKIKQYTPESFSKEKKFINSVVASLALMAVADKKVETSEVVKSLDIINSMQEIRELEMQKDAIELFDIHIEKLTSVIDSDVKFQMEVGKVLADIEKVKSYPEYIPIIKSILDNISMSDGYIAQAEVEMKNKILSLL